MEKPEPFLWAVSITASQPETSPESWAEISPSSLWDLPLLQASWLITLRVHIGPHLEVAVPPHLQGRKAMAQCGQFLAQLASVVNSESMGHRGSCSPGLVFGGRNLVCTLPLRVGRGGVTIQEGGETAGMGHWQCQV